MYSRMGRVSCDSYVSYVVYTLPLAVDYTVLVFAVSSEAQLE